MVSDQFCGFGCGLGCAKMKFLIKFGGASRSCEEHIFAGANFGNFLFSMRASSLFTKLFVYFPLNFANRSMV